MAFWVVSVIVMFFAVVHAIAVIKIMSLFVSILASFGKLVGLEDPVGGGIVLIILLLSIYFTLGFLRPAWIALRVLDNIKKRLRGFSSQPTQNDLEKVFAGDEKLRHQWSQYSESLHQQQQEKNGLMQTGAWRSTLPAEAFFNSQNIVDGRVNVEFFRHLPGILTGIGIIGTFAGLIHGLEGFDVSGGPEQVKTSLDGLMGSVKNAFWVSAGAIFAAMMITVLEKFLLARLYARVEWIAVAIDAFFVGGAGEEYLSRLVRASEDSASQSKILKDALVKDLGDLLNKLTHAQLASAKNFNQELIDQIKESAEQQKRLARENAETMSSAIAGTIRQSLEGPLQHIAQAVQTSTRDQSSSAAQMLGDVMAGFSERLNSLFGEQISGINELNRQTAQGMQGAADSLTALVTRLEESSSRTADDMANHTAQAIHTMSEGLNRIQDRVLENGRARESAMNEHTHALLADMSDRVEEAMREISTTTVGSLGNLVTGIAQAGQRSTNEMDARMAAVIDRMDERQRVIAAQTHGFVEQIKNLVDTSQDQTQKKLQETLGMLGQETSELLNALRAVQSGAFEKQEDRESLLFAQVKEIVKASNDATQQMAHNVTTLSSVSTKAIDGMNSGAERINGAVNQFSDAGRNVSGVMAQTAMLAKSLDSASQVLSSGAKAFSEELQNSQSRHNELAQLQSHVCALAESTRRELGLTADILQRIEGSVSKIQHVQVELADYVDGVSDVLKDSNDAFADAVTNAIGRVNNKFHEDLVRSVNLLRGGIDHLQQVLDDLPSANGNKI